MLINDDADNQSTPDVTPPTNSKQEAEQEDPQAEAPEEVKQEEDKKDKQKA